MLSKPVASAILLVVTLIWVGNFGLQFIPSLNYKPDPIYHAVFMSLVGGALAFTKKSDNGNNGGSGGTRQPPQSPSSPQVTESPTAEEYYGRHRREPGQS